MLLHAIDSVFRPNNFYDDEFCCEPVVSLKKLRKGDCSWSTIKKVLGWIIDTVAMTMQLPPHRQERLGEILAWHKILSELRSMSLALPGARNMFSTMEEEALTRQRKGTHIQLKKGVHQAPDDFRWMLVDTTERTLLSKTDNLATLFWQQKGSAIANNASSQLLCLFGIHQRYRRYVPRHHYISGTSNPLAYYN